MMNKILSIFSSDNDPSNAESNQKLNKVLIFIGIFVVLAVLLMMVGDDDKKSNKDNRDIGKFTIVDEDKMAKTRWVGDAAVDLKMAKKSVDTLTKDNEKLEKEVNELKKIVNDVKNQQDKSNKESPQGQKDDNKPFPFNNGGGKGLYTDYPKPNGDNTGNNEKNNPPFGITRMGDEPDVQKTSVTKFTKIEGSLEYTQVSKPTEPEKKSDPKDRQIISTGSITKAVLLNGIDAPTMTQAKSNPLPVLMKVTDLSILPNRWKYDVQECFLMGEGYGDLTAERAYIRTNNISCVTKNGKFIDMKFKGAASGEDGKLGLKGEVVTKQGALLARTLIAGFLQGVGDAFSKQNQIILTGTNGITTTTKDLNPNEAMQMGAFSGLSKSADKLSEFYLKMADQIYPVIEISGGREINIITTEMVELKDIEETTKNSTSNNNNNNTNNNAGDNK